MAVAQYLGRVNALELQLRAPLASVTQAAAEFTSQHNALSAPSTATLSADARNLRAAYGRITHARAQLRRLVPPAAARPLHTLLERLMAARADLTWQTALLVDFLPRFSSALRPLQPSLRRLEAVLSLNQARGPVAVQALYGEKVTALRSFRSVTMRMRDQLLRLTPPRLARPGYDSQLASLGAMSTSAGQLAAAIAGADTAAAARAIRAFAHAASEPRSAATTAAQAAAAKRYDADVARLTALGAAAERERLRLANTLR